MVLFDETIIVKEWENSMEKLKAWVLHVITKEWRCRFTLLDGTEFIGIPAQLENDKIIIYSLDEDGHKGEFKGFYNMSDLQGIETIENELRRNGMIV